MIELTPDNSSASTNFSDSKPGYTFKNVTKEAISLEELIANVTYLNTIAQIKSAISQKNGDY